MTRIFTGPEKSDTNRAIARSEHRAAHEPSRNLRCVSALTGGHRISRFAPTFTHRVHRIPAAKGHRQFILGKQEWRRG